MTSYDKYYNTEDLFGDPYPELVEFFKKYAPKGNLLDLGSGQGRNSIALSKLGYTVTAIDNSKKGIEQMNEKSLTMGLNVTGIVGDIYQFEDFQDFDIVLLDSMFHFTKKDKLKETTLLKKITTKILSGALLCVCIQDTGSKVKVLKESVMNCGEKVKVLVDDSIVYNYHDEESDHKSETKYCIFIIRKE